MSEPAEYDVAIVVASLAGCTCGIPGSGGRVVSLPHRKPTRHQAYKKLCTTVSSPADSDLPRLGWTLANRGAGRAAHASCSTPWWGLGAHPRPTTTFTVRIRREGSSTP